MTAPRLTRVAAGLRPAADVRMVHLGLGNFFRAHQAWYTDRAEDAADWGIAAFAGRSAGLADTLARQGGAFTLLVRSRAGTTTRQVASLSASYAAADQAAWLRLLAAPTTSVVTLTVTEAAYCRTLDGRLDVTDTRVADDLVTLTSGNHAALRSVPGRLLAGLMARRHNRAGELAVVPCDNISGNGRALASVIDAFAAEVDPTLPQWISDHVSFVDTMVDRITPAAGPEDAAEVAELTGYDDHAAVVTEEFSEWVLAGEFPSSRPDWGAVGARFVADAAPYEQRKLWLLNGAHSLIAYAGSVRGHHTVAEAVADHRIAAWVEDWWDVAAPHLALGDEETDRYRRDLLERFANPHLHHQLAQIAADGSSKLRERVVPVLRLEHAAGRSPRAATRTLAAWTLHLLGHGTAPVNDPLATAIGGHRRADDLASVAAAALGLIAPDLSQDIQLRRTVIEQAAELLA